MNVQKLKMGQAIFSHRCTHVVIQPSQCARACASFTFARCDWNCAEMDVGFHSYKPPIANGVLKYCSSPNGVNSKEH